MHGTEPQLVSFTGKVNIPGAEILVLDSASGYAGLSDENGFFTVPGLIWVPNFGYDLVISANGETGKLIRITPLDSFQMEGTVQFGLLDPSGGREILLRNYPGNNSDAFETLDEVNHTFYQNLFEELTEGQTTDEQKVSSVNSFMSTKLNYEDTQTEMHSPWYVIENGSRYCGHTCSGMAAILEAGGIKTRRIDIADGAPKPHTHVVLEAFYDGGWHLFDPTFGVKFRNKEGKVAGYGELRLDTNLIKYELFSSFHEKYPKVRFDWMKDAYGTGYHLYYYYKGWK